MRMRRVVFLRHALLTSLLAGFGDLQFSGTAGSGAAEVTVPPIPPQAGPELTLGFQLAL